MTEDFWNRVGPIPAGREADVETWLVLPLLAALGHARECIESKVAVNFQEGRKSNPGRKPEADFVVYAERPFCRATSLLVVETKRHNESLDGGKEQGESYAQNLRTPLLLMTNGRQLEVWQSQLTTESVCVFACELNELAGRRGDLEALLSRDAIKAHCATIEYKRFDVLARDLGAYERAEADRLARIGRSTVARTLRNRATNDSVRWSELLAMSGAVVVGSSGFGKTTLATALLQEALERRLEGKAQTLPFDVFLPDLALSGRALDEFLADRVAPHKPGFSRDTLRTVAREQGILVVADGFERIAPERRDAIKSILRNLRRDYPKSQLVVLSRASAAPADIGLPLLHLVEYTREDLHALAEARFGNRPDVAHAFSFAPDYVYSVSEVPLLASLVLDRFERDGRHTPQIAPLYESWLETILAASRPVDAALDRALLEKLARETVGGPIPVGRAMELTEPRADPERVLNRLAEADAIAVRGATVELPHEALADYLRALQFWREDPASCAARLSAFVFDPSSQFAILLIDTAPTAAMRGTAWQAVAKQDILLAIRSLRFAAGDETFGATTADMEARRFLGDIRETIEMLLSAHFSPIADLLREQICGKPLELLGIRGGVSTQYVNFSFFEAKGAPEAVRLGLDLQERAPRMYGHALERVGYGPETGRILGTQRLKEDLFDLVKSRRLPGGAVWIEERVFGRLRHLAQDYDAPVAGRSLQDALDVLAPHAAEWVGSGSFRAGQQFYMNELLDDMARLIGQGVSRIEPWWDDFRDLDLRSSEGQASFARTLDRYHQKRQLAYAEIAERSFPGLRPHLRTLRMMPFRLKSRPSSTVGAASKMCLLIIGAGR